MHAHTIDEAIAYMDTIVETSKKDRGSRLGYIAALYRKVTIKVKEEITAGFFDDNARMEEFDVIFANHYLQAYSQWQSGAPPSMVWQTTFQAADNWQPLVLQHLFLGMNAHINLDLGITAARVSPGAELESLHNDFNKINQVLGELVDSVIAGLGEIWPPLRRLTAGHADDVIINFSMSRARDQAWSLAEKLAPLSIKEQEDEIRDTDYRMSNIGRVITSPGLVANMLLLPIRACERGTIQQKINILSQPPEMMGGSELSWLSNS